MHTHTRSWKPIRFHIPSGMKCQLPLSFPPTTHVWHFPNPSGTFSSESCSLRFHSIWDFLKQPQCKIFCQAISVKTAKSTKWHFPVNVIEFIHQESTPSPAYKMRTKMTSSPGTSSLALLCGRERGWDCGLLCGHRCPSFGAMAPWVAPTDPSVPPQEAPFLTEVPLFLTFWKVFSVSLRCSSPVRRSLSLPHFIFCWKIWLLQLYIGAMTPVFATAVETIALIFF